ncbi:MAG: DUF6572 domain-containing protein [Bacilli bacterium]
MSIMETTVIDGVGVHKETGNVMFVISDHLDWSEEFEHLVLLQDKLNAYIAFIESGEINERYPIATGRAIEIVVYAKYNRSEKATEFYHVAGAQIAQIGITLRFELIDK